MKKFILILISGILLISGRLVAGPIVKNHISANADWLVHADHDLFNKSLIGRIIRSELVNRGVEEKFSNFKEIFSFHPIDDISNVTIYGQGKDREQAIVLIEGRFDKDKLLALVRMNPNYKQIEYNGINIQQWNQQKNGAAQGAKEQIMYGGFYDNDLIFIGADLDAIKHALDVLEGSQASADDEFFDNFAIESKNAFFQIMAKNVPTIVGNNPSAVLLRQTDQIFLEIGENEKNVFLNITLNIGSKEIAERVQKLLDGVIAYLTLSGNEQPDLAGLAQRIKLSVVENTITIDLELEPELAIEIISSGLANMRK